MLMGFALTFTSCGDDDEDEPQPNNPDNQEQQNNNSNNNEQNNNQQNNNEQNNNGQNTEIGEQTTDASIKGFIPEEYNGKKVAAWYFNSNVDQTKDKPEGVYCFDDGSLVVTAIENGTKIIEFKGDYKLTGDFENGTVAISVMGIEAISFKIDKGSIIEPEGRYTYTKQDNSKIPVFAKADKDESNGSEHGENIDALIEPFLPTAYADKNVVAWYAFTNIENDRTKTEAVYLFDDGTVVKTTFKFKTHDKTLVREIDMEATYTMTGDYENGTVTVKAPTGDTFEALIKDGMLSVPVMGNDKFPKQDNANLPDDSEPTNGDNGNQNQGEQGGKIDLTIIMRISNNTADGCHAMAYIDGLAGRTDLDLTKFYGAGFLISKFGVPTWGDALQYDGRINPTTFNIDADIVPNDPDDVTWTIVAFVRYDDDVYYSEPSTFTTQGNNGGNGNENQEDPGDEIETQAYLPQEYANGNEVIFWFENLVIKKDKGEYKSVALYFFLDRTFVVAKHKYDYNDNITKEKVIEAHGAYQMLSDEGQSFELTADTGQTMVCSFNEKGQLMIGEDAFTIQDIDDLPNPSK